MALIRYCFAIRPLLALTAVLFVAPAIGHAQPTDDRSNSRLDLFGDAPGITKRQIVYAGSSQSSFDADNIIEQFDVAKAGDVILLPVTFKGNTYSFLLDTGTAITVFDASLESLLGPVIESIEAQTPFGGKHLKLHAAPEAKVGHKTILRSSAVAIDDLRLARESLGYPVFGVLGVDALIDSIVHYDPDRGKLAFLKKGTRIKATSIPFSSDPHRQGRPFVDVFVEGRGSPVSFLVDTGASTLHAGALETALFDKCIELQTVQGIRISSLIAASGTKKSTSARLTSLTLAGFRHENLSFVRTEHNILGLAYLARFICTFDFEEKRLLLSKGEHYAALGLSPTSGLGLGRMGPRTVVSSVAPESSAAACGIKVGDELLSIGNKQAGHMSMHSIRTAVSAEGATVILVVQRDGKEVRITLQRPR
jgi:PDZ domain/Aspartyl protease